MEINVTEKIEEFTQRVIAFGKSACVKANQENRATPSAIYLLMLRERKMVTTAIPVPPMAYDNERTFHHLLHRYLPALLDGIRSQGITIVALAGVNEAIIMQREFPTVKAPTDEEIARMVEKVETEGEQSQRRSLVVMVETGLTTQLKAFNIVPDGGEITFTPFVEPEASSRRVMTPGMYSHLLRPPINEN